MRVVFAGTPPFAAQALEAILEAGHDVPLVLTQPDRPAGRGMRLASSAVAKLASERGLALFKPENLRPPEAQEPIRAAKCDVMVVAAYGIILPQAVLDIPSRGCLNIHASLLPRWRGAAPIQRALLAGDRETGIGIMKMEAGLDTGPVLLEKALPIEATDTADTLVHKLAMLGADAIVEALTNLDKWTPRRQEDSRATYAAKVTRSEAQIDWSEPAAVIDRMVRAFNPVPGAETTLDGVTLKVWKARLSDAEGEPGVVLEAGDGALRVACGKGSLVLEELQRPGSRRMTVSEYVRGSAIAPGTRLGGMLVAPKA